MSDNKGDLQRINKIREVFGGEIAIQSLDRMIELIDQVHDAKNLVRYFEQIDDELDLVQGTGIFCSADAIEAVEKLTGIKRESNLFTLAAFLVSSTEGKRPIKE